MTSNNIPKRRIGSTQLSVSELGFGAAALGNLYQAVNDTEAKRSLQKALELGISYIDTAPHYGRGLSERRLGDAIRLRRDVVISTKVGRLMLPDLDIVDDREQDGFFSPMPFRMHYDYSYDGVLRSYEQSLQRMGVANVDILLVHDIGTLTHGEMNPFYLEQLLAGGGLRALERLRDEGSIKAFGLGVNEVPICLNLLSKSRFDVILLAGRYTLLEQDALQDLMPACQEAETSIIVGGPFNSGVLATGVRAGSPAHYNYAPPPKEVIEKVGRIENIAERYGVPLAAAALAFVLAHPQVASVIPGMGSEALVTKNFDLYKENIPLAFWNDLLSSGLIREDAPLPR